MPLVSASDRPKSLLSKRSTPSIKEQCLQLVLGGFCFQQSGDGSYTVSCSHRIMGTSMTVSAPDVRPRKKTSGSHVTGSLAAAPRTTVVWRLNHVRFAAWMKLLGTSAFQSSVGSSSISLISLNRWSIHWSNSCAAGVRCASNLFRCMRNTSFCSMNELATCVASRPLQKNLKESWSVRSTTTRPGTVVISETLASSSYGCISKVPLPGPKNTRIMIFLLVKMALQSLAS
mmetsp:Transcript_46553/g.74036  ORF Transcript_46553/g.74036 Transcript_46553/m.74036 type:complete len:230 (+) Transcript_46553:1611-2300(+)